MDIREDGTQGSRNGNAKLTTDDVLTMRRLYSEGWTRPALAERFGVSAINVWHVVTGSSWSHLPGAIPGPRTSGRASEGGAR